MDIKYNRVSTLQQTGDRYTLDTTQYELTLLDRISGAVKFVDRPQAKKLIALVEQSKVSSITVEELSRLGRSTSDVINTLEYFNSKSINVIVRNIGLQSRPNNKPNPIFSMISAVLASVYELEKESIRERTTTGRAVALQKGVVMGRPEGTTENTNKFMSKPKSIAIKKYLDTGHTIREVAALTKSSKDLVMKVKSIIEV